MTWVDVPFSKVFVQFRDALLTGSVVILEPDKELRESRDEETYICPYIGTLSTDTVCMHSLTVSKKT